MLAKFSYNGDPRVVNTFSAYWYCRKNSDILVYVSLEKGFFITVIVDALSRGVSLLSCPFISLNEKKNWPSCIQ